MKKYMKSLCAFLALTLSVILFSLASCEKPLLTTTTDRQTTAAEGNLTVSVYQIEQTPFNSPTRGIEPASAVCTRLNFVIYDEGGQRVEQYNQTADKADFGTCTFQLEEGTYQLVIVGHSATGNPTMTNMAKIQFTKTTGYTDTYLYHSEVAVGEEPLNLSVALHRIASLCRFVLTDDIPADVKQMQFYYTGGSGAFNAATGLGTVNSKQTMTFDVTSGQKQFDLYTFLHTPDDTITLKVSALDASGNVLYEHTFDVPMKQNHITWLSGAFFAGTSSATTITGVTVNTDWAGETHITF